MTTEWEAKQFGPSVDKVQIQLPFGFYTAVPGHPEDGAAIGRDELGNATALNTWEQALLIPTPLPFGNRQTGLGPPHTIMIAPDSPIDSCDLWFGSPADSQRYRIGVGSPLLGIPSDLGEVRVTLPRAVVDPWDGSGEAGQTWLAENDVHDSMRGRGQSAISPLNDRAELTFPLRLWILRGPAPQVGHTARAPYCGDFFYALDGVTTAYAQGWVVTMGREAHEVTVSNLGVNPLVATVTGHKATVQTKGGVNTLNQDVRKRCPSVLDQITLDAGQTVTRFYAGRWDLLSCRIDHGGAAVKCAIHIETNDS